MAIAQLEQKFNDLALHLSETRTLAIQVAQQATIGGQTEFARIDDAGHLPFDSLGDPMEYAAVAQAGQLDWTDYRLHSGTSPVDSRNVAQSAEENRVSSGVVFYPPRLPPRPSRFCLDILELEGSVRYKLLMQSLNPGRPQQSLDALVQRMLRLLLTEKYWNDARMWYVETLGFEKLAPITRYRIAPTVENYAKIQPQFQPTALQMTKFHWPMVDWVPFPRLRDKLILHAHEIDLTDVLLSTMDNYCLESVVDYGDDDRTQSLSAAVEQDSPGRPLPGTEPVDTGTAFSRYNRRGGKTVYYRLNEYIDYVNSPQPSSTEPHLTSYRRGSMPKSVEAEFVLALRQVSTPFKLERRLFDRFPVLFCDEVIAQGEYRPVVSEDYTEA